MTFSSNLKSYQGTLVETSVIIALSHFLIGGSEVSGKFKHLVPLNNEKDVLVSVVIPHFV